MSADEPLLRTLDGVPAEIFVPPSTEAKRLLRVARWLVSPADGRGGPISRLVRMILVAPFTQLTLVSFDLQMFLFQVFHRTLVARVGHAVFMASTTFFALAALASFPLGPRVTAATIGALVLLVWYAVVAFTARLRAWFLVMIPIVVALYLGALAFHQAGFRHAWAWMFVSAFFIALSHAPEPKLPPRSVPGPRWLSIREYVFVEGLPFHVRLGRAVRVGLFVVWGTFDEWIASPRLLPYNVLALMFRAGYATDRYRELVDRAERAVASGNPALDYVGIGGGTFLRVPD